MRFRYLYPLILLVVRNTKVDYKGASACINRHINHGMDAALILMELHFKIPVVDFPLY